MYYNNVPPPYFGSGAFPWVQGREYPLHFRSPGPIFSPTQDHLQQDRSRGHTHGHGGATTCQDDHVHLHPGVTGTPIETERGHVHKMSGNTTFDDGHIHSYEAFTSPPISLPNGYHTHYAEIRTTEDDGHIHIIRGFTQPSRS
ncbi:YmaF family protein [Halobacillus sp. Marseille-P3879]|uniref:YmaF family protein n=1 Tax=Halobacillus sp. Marseille-P3879 TaxID=2045014 RepID=UPI000C7A0356|nr:YmaF family protein [Halobacillus sp. Marseille-P3879]